jgi:hypothetical protein
VCRPKLCRERDQFPGNPISFTDPFGLDADDIFDDAWTAFKKFSNAFIGWGSRNFNFITWGFNLVGGITGIDPLTGLPVSDRGRILFDNSANIGLGLLNVGFLQAGAAFLDARALAAIRQSYIDEVLQLGDLATASRLAGADAEATAQLLNAERNALKSKYRELSPSDSVQQFEQRNMEKYGNPLGPNIDQLRASGKSWEDIIESASRPGGKDLGF